MVDRNDIRWHPIPRINFPHLTFYNCMLTLVQPNLPLFFPPVLYYLAFVVLVRTEVEMTGLPSQLRNILITLIIRLISICIALFAFFLFKEFSKKGTCISKRSLRSFIRFLVLFLSFDLTAIIISRHISLECTLCILLRRISIMFWRTFRVLINYFGTRAHSFYLFLRIFFIKFIFNIPDFFIYFLNRTDVRYCLPLSLGLLRLKLVVGEPALVLIYVLGLLCVLVFYGITSIIIYLVLHF